jgi:hypothetical protein
MPRKCIYKTFWLPILPNLQPKTFGLQPKLAMYSFSHHELQQMVGMDQFSLMSSRRVNKEIAIKDPKFL